MADDGCRRYPVETGAPKDIEDPGEVPHVVLRE